MAGYTVDEQLYVLCDGFFDNIEDFINFSPADEVLGIVDSVGRKDGGGSHDSQITTDAGSQAFLSLDDRLCQVTTNSDDNKICDDINISEDWVAKFLDDSYLDFDFSATATATATFINDNNESQFRSPSPNSVLEPNNLNFSGKVGSSSSPCSSSSSSSCNSSNIHVVPTTTLVPARARSKRPRRAAPVSPSMPIPPVIPTLLPECESFGESCPPPMKKKKIKKNHAAGNTSAESGIVARRCLHCGLQKTPQWRGGPMGPKTLCNACGVRYKSGRLFPEYRPAASPTFVPTIHSNSHKKVVEMRIKACQKKVESGMPLPQCPAAKNCELLAYIK